MADVSINPAADQLPYPDFAGAAVEGAQAGQALRGISALQGIDLNDPDSVNRGLTSLVRAGAADQARAVIDLQMGRFKQNAQVRQYETAPGIFGAGSAPPGAPPTASAPTAAPQPAALTPQQTAQRAEMLKAAKTGVQSIMGETDPTLRKAQYDATAAKLGAMGMDPAYIDHMTNGGTQLDDAHLQSISDSIDQTAAHPAFGGSGEAAPLTPHPASMAYATTKAPNLLSRPDVQAWLAQGAAYGQDVRPIVDALKETQGYTGPLAPGQSAAYGGRPTYQAPYAPVTAAPGDRVIDQNSGGVIAEAPFAPVQQEPGHPLVDQNTGKVIAPAPPWEPKPVTAPMGDNVFNYNPNNPTGGQAPGGPRPELRAEIVANPGAALGALLGGNPTITSTVRSPDQNAKAGGSPTSEHIPGNGDGFDFTPPKGMTAHQAIERLIAQGVPFDQLINEGSTVHLGFGNGAPRGEILNGAPHAGSNATVIGHAPWAGQQAPQGGSSTSGFSVLARGQPVVQGHQDGIAGLVNRSPNGAVERIAGTGVDKQDEQATLARVMDQGSVKEAREGMAAYAALRSAEPTMTGPTAYGMLDSLAKSFGNSGLSQHRSAEDIKNTFGVTDQVASDISKMFGQGSLTPKMRQEIMDAAYGFVKAHYDQASGVVEPYRDFLNKNGADGSVLDKALPKMPYRYYADRPPTQGVLKGMVIDTPKGPRLWDGVGWRTP